MSEGAYPMSRRASGLAAKNSSVCPEASRPACAIKAWHSPPTLDWRIALCHVRVPVPTAPVTQENSAACAMFLQHAQLARFRELAHRHRRYLRKGGNQTATSPFIVPDGLTNVVNVLGRLARLALGTGETPARRQQAGGGRPPHLRVSIPSFERHACVCRHDQIPAACCSLHFL